MDHSSKASLLAVFSRSAYFPTDCWLVWLLLSWRGRQQEFLFIFFRRKMKSVANFRRIWYGARGIQCAYHAKASCTASGSGASSSEAGFHYPYSLFFTNSSRLGGSGTVAADRVSGTRRILGSILATTIGAGLVAASTSSEIAFAEKNNNENHRSYNVDAKSTTEKNVDMEKVVRQERERVEERLRKSDLQGIVLPSFTIAAKGQQVAVRFQVPPSCDISHLIIDVVSHLGLKTDDSGGGSEMILRAWDSAVARQLILAHPDQHVTKDFGKDQRLEILKEETLSHRTIDGNNICILVFEPLIGSNNAEVEFLKRGSFTVKELDALVSALRIAGGSANARRATQKKHREASKHRDRQSSGPNLSSDAKALEALEAMGVKIYGLETANGSSDSDGVSWDNIAGYHEQKREIEDTILLTLRRPEIYDNIARGTRRKFESNRPRAVLFEGPPGTGKTSCARVIASQAGVPLLYVPLEVVMSKYYGESERMLGTVFTLANELPDGAIIFLDEVDSFAAARDKEMHEATRRILSVLLRQIDGFEQEKRVVVIAATNRKQDLDPALISRFDLSVTFNLPDQQTREEIAAQYARHLSTQELATFAAVTEGMSGRDLRDICQQAERRWASKLIRGQVGDSSMHGLPPIQEYMECAMKRQQTLHKWHVEENSFMGDDQRAGSQMKKWPSVVV